VQVGLIETQGAGQSHDAPILHDPAAAETPLCLSQEAAAVRTSRGVLWR
jgi:hypothetical protein